MTLVVVLVSKFARRRLGHDPARPGAAGPVPGRQGPLPGGRRARWRPTSRSTPPGWSRRWCCVPIRGWSAITRKALRLALKISPEIYALHIAGDEQAMATLEDGWERLVRAPRAAAHLPAPKLIVVYSPYRRLYGPLKQVVSDLQRTHPDRDIAVIVPELVGDALVSLPAAQPDGGPHQGVPPAQRLPARRRHQRSLVSRRLMSSRPRIDRGARTG